MSLCVTYLAGICGIDITFLGGGGNIADGGAAAEIDTSYDQCSKIKVILYSSTYIWIQLLVEQRIEKEKEALSVLLLVLLCQPLLVALPTNSLYPYSISRH